ncbi:MAG: hypothetical protein GEU92_14375 [Alphaproteobacteria bacterium]|nr:hypothetical protein [Alphaproteobacteria bacterium]
MRLSARPLPRLWQDKTTIVLSAILAASPWLLGYADLGIAKWNAVVLGAVLGLGASAMLLWRPCWPDFWVAFMAFWLAMSPRILGFSDRLAPTVTADVIGAAVVVLALWAAVLRSRALLETPHAAGSEPPARPPVAPDRPRKAA